MELSRRDLLKLGFFGSAALMLPAERIARTELALAQPHPGEPAARAVHRPVRRAAGPRAGALGRPTPTSTRSPRGRPPPRSCRASRRRSGATTASRPGPTIVVPQGPQDASSASSCACPRVHPTLRYNGLDLDAPARVGVAAAVRRLRQRLHEPGPVQGLPVPQLPERADALVPRPRGPHHRAERVHGARGDVPPRTTTSSSSLPIPHGLYDVPLVIKDAMFTSSGELIFDDNGGRVGHVRRRHPRQRPAVAGDAGRAAQVPLPAAQRLDLALLPAGASTGDPFTVIGTDGGLMPAPQDAPTIRIGMAERYEVSSTSRSTRSARASSCATSGLTNNIDFDTTGVVMAFDVAGDATDTANNEVPPVLNPDNEVDAPPAVAGADDAADGLQAPGRRVDGRTARRGRTSSTAASRSSTRIPELGDVEIWELRNNSNGWFHPVHVHLVDFQILDRNGRPPPPYERGPKDVVYVGEGETVRVLMRFGPHVGRYMMHCHNLVHEDHDMMVQFEVGTGGPDPIDTTGPRQPAPDGDEPSPGRRPAGRDRARRRRPSGRRQRHARPKPKRKVKVKGKKVRKRKPKRKKRRPGASGGRARARPARRCDGRRHPGGARRAAGPRRRRLPRRSPRRSPAVAWVTSPTPPRTCASGGPTGRSSSPPAPARRCSRRWSCAARGPWCSRRDRRATSRSSGCTCSPGPPARRSARTRACPSRPGRSTSRRPPPRCPRRRPADDAAPGRAAPRR